MRGELKNGAGSKNRTHDLLITNQLLYQLSYAGMGLGLEHCAPVAQNCFARRAL
jgi:hypothetical protein